MTTQSSTLLKDSDANSPLQPKELFTIDEPYHMPPHSTSDQTDSRSNTFSSYLSNLNSNRTSSIFSPSHNPEEDKMEEAINNVSFQLLNLLDSEKPVTENLTASDDSAVITCSNISYYLYLVLKPQLKN